MSRTMSIALGICCLALSSASAGVSSAAGVDAVAAATTNGKMKFTPPFAVTATTAVITWQFEYTDGSAVLTYSSTAADQKSKTLTAAQRTARSIRLDTLKANTTYTIKIVATKTNQDTAIATGSFKTAVGTSVGGLHAPERSLLFGIGSAQFSINAAGNEPVQITCVASNGVTVMNRTVLASQIRGVDLPRGLKPGSYLVKLRTRSETVTRGVVVKN